MRFTQLRAAAGETVDASYGVYINDENMNHQRKVSNCAHTHHGTGGDDGSKVYPCPTWQVSIFSLSVCKVVMKVNLNAINHL